MSLLAETSGKLQPLLAAFIDVLLQQCSVCFAFEQRLKLPPKIIMAARQLPRLYMVFPGKLQNVADALVDAGESCRVQLDLIGILVQGV